jgi:hypothetical protein
VLEEPERRNKLRFQSWKRDPNTKKEEKTAWHKLSKNSYKCPQAQASRDTSVPMSLPLRQITNLAPTGKGAGHLPV